METTLNGGTYPNMLKKFMYTHSHENLPRSLDWVQWTNLLAPCLLYITALDFFLWGYVKDRVYATHVPDLPTLQDHIHNVIATVTPDMLHGTWQESEYRLDIICATSGSHAEV
jgi:hypothetical protein